MKYSAVGKKLYFSVLSVFLLFAATFIIFQQFREKQFKISSLTQTLYDYNSHCSESILNHGQPDEAYMDAFLKRHQLQGIRLTLVRPDGKVIYDNQYKDYKKLGNLISRPEIQSALNARNGFSINRRRSKDRASFLYAASYFPKMQLIIRTALPYGHGIAQVLRSDKHFLWFSLVAILLLTLVLYRFVSTLGKNISKLRTFAYRADHDENLYVEDLLEFPNDELGEIAERIIKIYKRLETTRKEQDVLKRQLTQNVAHELKTPVASIQGYLETIIANPTMDENTRNMFLKRCYAQSERLTSLLRDISTLNRMDDAPQVKHFESVDIAGQVRDIISETALQFEERNMTFINSLPAHLIVQGNRSLLYSVFRNLTDNALAYAGDGTTVHLSAQREGNAWKFHFSDNGVGVAPEHLPRLFERFYRVDKGRSRKMGGTGLGLAIVKNAVLIHGGTIAAELTDGGGLTFVFTLQIYPKEQPETPAKTKQE